MQLPKFLPSFSQTIFRTSSNFSKDIKVIEINQERRLLVNGTIQSVFPLDNNWQRFEKRCWGIMKNLAVDVLSDSDKKHVLLLGLAGGTMVHLLSNAFPQVKITAIEIDAALVDVGREHFFLNQPKNLTIINNDAQNLPDNCYNIIINDLFSSVHSPNFVDDEEYLLQLRDRLEPDGLLICNRIYEEKEIRKREEFLIKLERIFAKAGMLEVESGCKIKNYVFWGRR